MGKFEILQYVANIHNHLTQVMVSGDNAILMGDALKDLRVLAQMLQTDVEAEQEAEAKKEKEEGKTDK